MVKLASLQTSVKRQCYSSKTANITMVGLHLKC